MLNVYTTWFFQSPQSKIFKNVLLKRCRVPEAAPQFAGGIAYYGGSTRWSWGGLVWLCYFCDPTLAKQ